MPFPALTVVFHVELRQVSRFAPMLQAAVCIASLEGGARLDLHGQELHIG
jgi:hypothetical protein